MTTEKDNSGSPNYSILDENGDIDFDAYWNDPNREARMATLRQILPANEGQLDEFTRRALFTSKTTTEALAEIIHAQITTD